MQSPPPPIDHLESAANDMSSKEEPPSSDEQLDANQEWLLYQQRVAQLLAGDFRPSPNDTRRIPPQPLDEAQLNVLHTPSQIQSSPEVGTLVTDYVGAVPHASFSIHPPAPIVPIESELPQPLATPDRVLPWAKRLAYALLGAFLGIYLYSTGDQWPYLSELVPNLATISAALFLAFLMRNRSNYAKYGAIAATMTLLLSIPLLLGHESYKGAADLVQELSQNNPNMSDIYANDVLNSITKDYDKGLFYIGTGIGMTLLATLAVLRSQRGAEAAAGLLLVGIALTVALATLYPGSLVNIIIYAIPLFMILLYMTSSHRRGDDPPPDSRR